MPRYWFALVTVSLVLPGCASAPPTSGSFAGDRTAQHLNKPVRHKHRPTAAVLSRKADKPDPNLTAAREKELATLRPYSAAWWAVQDEIEGEESRRINEKIVICRTCLQPVAPEDYTASIRH
jgi:hypothetical protein